MDLSEFLNALPVHECSLSLIHNNNRDFYETCLQMVESRDYPGNGTWVSEEQKTKAIETNDYWTLHWYPRTPVGSYIINACDLDALLEYVQANAAEFD